MYSTENVYIVGYEINANYSPIKLNGYCRDNLYCEIKKERNNLKYIKMSLEHYKALGSYI